MSAPQAPGFLTSGQVARLCGVRIKTVQAWANEGKLSVFRLPARGDRRFYPDEVQRFIDRYRPEFSPDPIKAVDLQMLSKRIDKTFGEVKLKVRACGKMHASLSDSRGRAFATFGPSENCVEQAQVVLELLTYFKKS